MITPMKKLTFLVYHKEYESFLEQVRTLGVVHIVERQQGEMDADLQQSVQKRNLYKNTLQRLANLADKQAPACRQNNRATVAEGDAIVAAYERQQAQMQELAQQLPSIDKEIEQMETWGEFAWEDVERLRDAGWFVQFYECTDREYKEEWEEDYHAIIINDEGAHRCFVTVTPMPVHLDIEPLRLPDESLSELQAKRKATVAAMAKGQAELADFATKELHTLQSANEALQHDIDWQKVHLSSERMAEGAVVMLEGWVPVDNEAAVVEFLNQSGAYYEIRAARREDNPPVKFRNNAFTRMYEVLTRMYGMPSFTDFDPTPILAPFFSLFFAFCMGDAGYGLILIALGFLLKKKLSKDMAGMMNLVITLGIFTTVFGAILGTFFGMSLLNTALPQDLKNFIIAGNIEIMGATYDKQMILALGIGVVHISLAMTVKAINSTVFFGFKESLSAWGWWLAVVGSVIVGALTMLSVIPAEVSQWAFVGVAGVGAIGIYLLNNLHRNVLMNIGAGLWDTYNMASGLLGDTLSYIRLFALGLAGGMLGQTFNNLALMVVEGTEGISAVFGWIGFGAIILLGHTLNIAMSCLSAFVHPLRLTFVEYFKNAGYEGKGEEYKPFKN